MCCVALRGRHIAHLVTALVQQRQQTGAGEVVQMRQLAPKRVLCSSIQDAPSGGMHVGHAEHEQALGVKPLVRIFK